jgi:hypothetical protein
MHSPLRTAVIACVGLAPMLVAANAIAADVAPVAVVMEVAGTTRPPLSVHRELPPGTRIALERGARVALLHYSSCSIVTVSGGDITVTAQGLETTEGADKSAKPGPCPRVHRIMLAGPGPLGGVVVSRGGTATPPVVVAASAHLIVTGGGALIAAQLLDDNDKVVVDALPIRDGELTLPDTLVLRRPYVLRLRIQGQDAPVDIPISTAGPSAGAMLVLRIE